MPPDTDADVLVVGAGPGGLHAALKAAVLGHSVLLVDKGREHSRVFWAPALANVPTAPGISGEELLARGRDALARFRDVSGKALVRLVDEAEVVDLAREGDAYRARVRDASGEWEARAGVVVLATGVVDRKPGLKMSPFVHKSRVGHCILCEGWSLAGKRVAVVGHTRHAAHIADAARAHFRAEEVVMLTDGRTLDEDARPKARVETRRILAIEEEGGLALTLEGAAAPERFDKALFVLGWHHVNHALAKRLGARLTPEGHVETSEDREVLGEDGRPIRGLYAVGDLRAGAWKQVPLAWADAEIAVTAAYAYRLD